MPNGTTAVFENVAYGPNPYYIDNGGKYTFKFDVVFSGPVPSSYNWTVAVKDRSGAVVKSLTGSTTTGGQARTTVTTTWDGTDSGGNRVAYGGYAPTFTATWNPGGVTQDVCSGIPIPPGPCSSEPSGTRGASGLPLSLPPGAQASSGACPLPPPSSEPGDDETEVACLTPY